MNYREYLDIIREEKYKFDDIHFFTYCIAIIGYNTKNDFNTVVGCFNDYYINYVLKHHELLHCLGDAGIIEDITDVVEIPKGSKSFLTYEGSIVRYKGIASNYNSLIHWLWFEDYNGYNSDNNLIGLIREVYASDLSKEMMDFDSFLYWQNTDTHHRMFLGEEVDFDFMT